MQDERSRTSGLWFLVGGVAIGAVLGVLFAPKKGSDLREDIGDLGRQGREKSQALISKVGGMIPLRVKAAAALGAMKAGGAEALREVKESLLDGAV